MTRGLYAVKRNRTLPLPDEQGTPVLADSAWRLWLVVAIGAALGFMLGTGVGFERGFSAGVVAARNLIDH